jgi:hypothetical protein
VIGTAGLFVGLTLTGPAAGVDSLHRQSMSITRAADAPYPLPLKTPNWAGYVVTAGATTYTSVTGTWTQPRVACSVGDHDAAVAFWVGLGGSTPNAQGLEQAGTASHCASGRATYHAWYEIVPNPPVAVELGVTPGDTITASVNVVQDGAAILFQIKNRTRKTMFTGRVQLAKPPDLSSAEWITEAPTGCAEFMCLPVPLLDFQSVSFSRIAALGNDIGGALTRHDWTSRSLRLVPSSVLVTGPGPVDAAAGALPSQPAPHGRSFDVVWIAGQ